LNTKNEIPDHENMGIDLYLWCYRLCRYW